MHGYTIDTNVARPRNVGEVLDAVLNKDRSKSERINVSAIKDANMLGAIVFQMELHPLGLANQLNTSGFQRIELAAQGGSIPEGRDGELYQLTKSMLHGAGIAPNKEGHYKWVEF